MFVFYQCFNMDIHNYGYVMAVFAWCLFGTNVESCIYDASNEQAVNMIDTVPLVYMDNSCPISLS